MSCSLVIYRTILTLCSYLSDLYSDTTIHLPGDSLNETGINLYGCLKQLYLLKKQNRNLKVLLSIGGWTYSSNFARPASTSPGRTTFASSAVALVRNMGFDGLDIDWEYPTDDTEAGSMVSLLQTVRSALDTYGNSLSPPYHFMLSVTCPAGSDNYKKLHLADMAPYIDFWNLMAFDYAGSWSSITGNQANLFNSTTNPASTPFDTETVVNYYTSHDIPSSQIVLGMPIYGRSFEATDGLGKPFSGVGIGTWEAGAYDYKALPLSGAVIHYDNFTGSSYSYDTVKRELISYDTTAVARQKATWIQQMGLGGAMWWESSADGVGDQSLIQNVVEVLGGVDGSGLESSPNRLEYPNSTFENLRAGMGSGLALSLSSNLPIPVLSIPNSSPTTISSACSSPSNPSPDVPQSETTLPGSQSMSTYTIKASDTFTSVADSLGLSVSALEAANPGVVPTALQIGQVINLPGHASKTIISTIKSTRTITVSCVAASVTSVYSGKYKPKLPEIILIMLDTIVSLSPSCFLASCSLPGALSLTKSTAPIMSDTSLDIPGGATTSEAPQSTPTYGGIIVGPGDTWASIADINEISVSVLEAANPGITSLEIGQLLNIPEGGRVTVGGDPLTMSSLVPLVTTIGSVTLTAGGPAGTVDGSSYIALGTNGVLEITVMVAGELLTSTVTAPNSKRSIQSELTDVSTVTVSCVTASVTSICLGKHNSKMFDPILSVPDINTSSPSSSVVKSSHTQVSPSQVTSQPVYAESSTISNNIVWDNQCPQMLYMLNWKGSTTSTMFGELSIQSYISRHPEQTQLQSLLTCSNLLPPDLSSTASSPTSILLSMSSSSSSSCSTYSIIPIPTVTTTLSTPPPSSTAYVTITTIIPRWRNRSLS